MPRTVRHTLPTASGGRQIKHERSEQRGAEMPLGMLSNGSVRAKRLNLSPKICVMRRAAAERFARYNSANATVSMAETVDLKLLFQIYRL